MNNLSDEYMSITDEIELDRIRKKWALERTSTATEIRFLLSLIDSKAAEGDVQLSGFLATGRLRTQEATAMTKNYDDFRAGMLRAAEIARNEFKRAPEAAKGHDCVYMGGYEDACDHLSVIIANAAVIDCVRIAGAQPDWQYHISLLLPDDGVEDTALLKVYQVVEHELRAAATQMRDKCVEVVGAICDGYKSDLFSTDDEAYKSSLGFAVDALDKAIAAISFLTLDPKQ